MPPVAATTQIGTTYLDVNGQAYQLMACVLPDISWDVIPLPAQDGGRRLRQVRFGQLTVRFTPPSMAPLAGWLEGLTSGRVDPVDLGVLHTDGNGKVRHNLVLKGCILTELRLPECSAAGKEIYAIEAVLEPERVEAGPLGGAVKSAAPGRAKKWLASNFVVTVPGSVEYQVLMIDDSVIPVDSPAELPDESKIVEVCEPWMTIEIITPTDYYGPIMDIVTKRRGIFKQQEYPAPHRVQLDFESPLSEIIIDFFDDLKSRTKGYASLDYQFLEYRPDELQKLEILVNGEPLDALATIVQQKDAYHKGQRLITKLKDLIPRKLYDVAVQASSGVSIISRANVKATRKDVLAKCYGGDITRKKKLHEKQKEGKKRLKMAGNVEIPQDAFMAVLKLNEE